jgi:hypothetical protein
VRACETGMQNRHCEPGIAKPALRNMELPRVFYVSFC